MDDHMTDLWHATLRAVVATAWVEDGLLVLEAGAVPGPEEMDPADALSHVLGYYPESEGDLLILRDALDCDDGSPYPVGPCARRAATDVLPAHQPVDPRPPIAESQASLLAACRRARDEERARVEEEWRQDLARALGADDEEPLIMLIERVAELRAFKAAP